MRWQQKQTCDTWDGHILLLWSFSSHHYIWIKEVKSLCSSSAGSMCHTVPTALNRFAAATHRAAYLYRRFKKCKVFFKICSLSGFSSYESSFFPVTACSSSLGGRSTPFELIYSQSAFTEICSSQWQHSGVMLATLITNEHQFFFVGRLSQLCNHHF